MQKVVSFGAIVVECLNEKSGKLIDSEKTPPAPSLGGDEIASEVMYPLRFHISLSG